MVRHTKKHASRKYVSKKITKKASRTRSKKSRGGAANKVFRIQLKLTFYPKDPIDQATSQVLADTYHQPSLNANIEAFIKQKFPINNPNSPKNFIINLLMPLVSFMATITNVQWKPNFTVQFDAIVPMINRNTGQPFTINEIKTELKMAPLEDQVYMPYETNGWLIYKLENVNGTLEDINNGQNVKDEFGHIDYRENPINVTAL